MLTQTNGMRLHRLDSQSQHSQNVSWVHGGDNNLSSNSNNICMIIVSICLSKQSYKESVNKSDKEVHKKQG